VAKWADLYGLCRRSMGFADGSPRKPRKQSTEPSPFSNVRARFRAGAQDQFDVDYSGSSVWLSTGGMPAGLELWPDAWGPLLFYREASQGQSEADEFSSFPSWLDPRTGRQLGLGSAAGALRLFDCEFGYTAGAQRSAKRHRAFWTAPSPARRRFPTWPPETREEARATWQPGELRIGGHTSSDPCREDGKLLRQPTGFTTPSDMNLITADGAPAFVAEFKHAGGHRETVNSFSARPSTMRLSPPVGRSTSGHCWIFRAARFRRNQPGRIVRAGANGFRRQP